MNRTPAHPLSLQRQPAGEYCVNGARWRAWAAAALLLFPPLAQAADLLVLDFDLNDLTLNPMPEEIERAAVLGPMLSTRLRDVHGHNVLGISERAVREAAKGKSYLYDKPRLMAQIGKEASADWVVSGRLHKGSYLFVYLMAQIIDPENGRIDADFVVEIKGQQDKLTAKGIETLAAQIDAALETLASRKADKANSPNTASEAGKATVIQ